MNSKNPKPYVCIVYNPEVSCSNSVEFLVTLRGAI